MIFYFDSNKQHFFSSLALPTEDFITNFKAPKRSFDIPTDRADVIFFQRNLLQWHKNVQQRIYPFANDVEEETGESLLNKTREEQDIMRGEALKLQGRAKPSRRRARERHPNRSKEQVRIRRLHATLVLAYSEALRATVDSRVTVATRVGLKADRGRSHPRSSSRKRGQKASSSRHWAS